VEALIRLAPPDPWLDLANQFIPLARRPGLIVPIGRWVLENACEQAFA